MRFALFIITILTSFISNSYANSRCGLYLTKTQTAYIEERLNDISNFSRIVLDYSVEKQNLQYIFKLTLKERFQLPAEVKKEVLSTGNHVKWTDRRGYTYDSSPYTIKETGTLTVSTFAALYPRGITTTTASPWVWNREYQGSGLFLETALENVIKEALLESL